MNFHTPRGGRGSNVQSPMWRFFVSCGKLHWPGNPYKKRDIQVGKNIAGMNSYEIKFTTQLKKNTLEMTFDFARVASTAEKTV